MPERLIARTLHNAYETLAFPVITIDDGRILDITAGEPNQSTEVFTAPFVDVHVHGAVAHDFMTARAAEIHAIGRYLAGRGVAHYLATTVTSTVDSTLQALERLGASICAPAPRDAAVPVGIHLEGPFLCPAKRGVHPVDRILAPSVELFDRFQEAARGAIRLITLAPEMPGALELIQHLAAQGVRVSMGHSNATWAEAQAGIEAGAAGATHTFNAMRGVDHREPGLAGAVLDHEDLYAEAIVDGVHLHPAIVRLWFRAKGEQRAVLVTDGMSATGMPDGTYHLGDLVVEVKRGVCMSGGALAGSVLTMDRAVSNLCAFTGTDLATAVRAASRNPAAMIGMAALGEVQVGGPAHFNVYSSDTGQYTATILHGQRLGKGHAL